MAEGPLEREIQAAIMDALRVAGFTVLHTSAFRQKGPSGVAKGVPDLLCWHDCLGPICFGIEVKRPGEAITPEQQAMIDKGFYSVACSAYDAVMIALKFCEDRPIVARTVCKDKPSLFLTVTNLERLEQALRPARAV